jgi:hypothetical protein
VARCDQGYLCRVCGEEVEHITDSELYLRYVIGEIDPETLHLASECHLRCAPALSQFIVDNRFDPPVEIKGPFSQTELDPDFVQSRASLINRGYGRLWAIRLERRKPLTVLEYPLTEFIQKWQ